MTATPSIQQLAATAAEWFETAERVEGDEDSRFTRTKDGAPEWVTDLVRAAHGSDFLPDDWRYTKIREALEFIAGSDDPEDGCSEFADEAVDVYTGELLEWLASNLQRPGYCDEATAEFGLAEGGIVSQVARGQYMEASEIYGLVIEALEGSAAVL